MFWVSIIALLLFPSFRRALVGDGSLRKLTYLTRGAGTAYVWLSIQLDADSRIAIMSSGSAVACERVQHNELAFPGIDS
jgi:hypothetical protein